MKQSGSGVHVFELAFELTENILNADSSYVCRTDVHFDSHMPVQLPIVDAFVLGRSHKTRYNYCKR